MATASGEPSMPYGKVLVPFSYLADPDPSA